MHQVLTTSAAVLLFAVLYAVQPLLAHFANDYQLQAASAGTLMTATLLPLAVAPLFYGVLLSKISAAKLLRYALLALAVSCILFANASNFWQLLALRLVQGLLLPAAVTAISSDIGANSAAWQLQRNMSIYITGTIIGGLLGRVLAGLVASYWHWQLFYYILAALLFSAALWVRQAGQQTQHAPLPNFANIRVIAAERQILKLYLAVFCMFFCFVAVLNYLPFIVASISEQPSEALMGTMYSGFIMGAVASLGAAKLRAQLGPRLAMSLGFGIFISALLLLFNRHLGVIFALVFAYCAGNFLVHSIASATVNQLAKRDKNLINALYVSCYYGGGVFGSYLPGIIWQHYGQHGFLYLLLAVNCLGLGALLAADLRLS